MQALIEHPSNNSAPLPRISGLWHGFGKQRDNILIAAAYLLVALLISCGNLSTSGPLWPDASQYANAGAMVHDWLLSGQWLRPWAFASANYAQYPGFHLPYHPPAYPALLGLFFVLTGVSYAAARVFIGLCLWVSACAFYAILRRTGTTKPVAFCCTLVLMTMPDIATWSRDTMSEIPGLALILAASYCVVVSLKHENPAAWAGAFLLAEAAFLSRYLSAGVIPAWFLWKLLRGRRTNWFSAATLVPPAAYLVVSAAWVMFAMQFSRYENSFGSTPPNRNYAELFSRAVAEFYLRSLPSMAGLLTTAIALAYGVWLILSRRDNFTKYFWISWFAGCLVLALSVGIYAESRYFIYALPGLAGLLALFVGSVEKSRYTGMKYATWTLMLLCLAGNVRDLSAIPHGVVGYEPVGQHLAGLRERGNVLFSGVQQAELLFRYRANNPAVARRFIRADRALTLRAPSYTDVAPRILATTPADVLSLVLRGRIRYVVSFTPEDEIAARTAHGFEVALLHRSMTELSGKFERIASYGLLIQYGATPAHGQLVLWRFKGSLPEGPSEIPVEVPTADLVLKPEL